MKLIKPNGIVEVESYATGNMIIDYEMLSPDEFLTIYEPDYGFGEGIETLVEDENEM